MSFCVADVLILNDLGFSGCLYFLGLLGNLLVISATWSQYSPSASVFSHAWTSEAQVDRVGGFIPSGANPGLAGDDTKPAGQEKNLWGFSKVHRVITSLLYLFTSRIQYPVWLSVHFFH